MARRRRIKYNEWKPHPKMDGVAITSVGSNYVMIDVWDIPKVAPYYWTDRDNRRIRRHTTTEEKRAGLGAGITLHRQIAGPAPAGGMEIDHINRDHRDNRRANLRWVTHAINMANMGSATHGVHFEKARNCYRVTFSHGKLRLRKRFPTLEAALGWRAMQDRRRDRQLNLAGLSPLPIALAKTAPNCPK